MSNKEVYWLTADQDLDNQLIQIALKKKWLSETDKDFDQAEVARNRFRDLSDCLIVFDNVETSESIKNYLPKDRETTHILITSREKQTGFRQIDLDVLNLLHASDLLLKVAEREPENDLDEKGLEEILKQLGGLPLALELVGGYLKEHSNVSFAKYFEFLQDVPLDRLEAEFPDDNFTRHDKSIIRTLRISEKLLTAKPILNDILDVLAWSGTSSMDISLLRDLVGTKDDFDLLTALGDAINLRLIRKEDGERYAIHRLLAKVRRHENPLENRKEWHLEKIKRLKEWFYKRKDDFNKLLKFEAEIEHLKEWQKQSTIIAPSETTYLLALRAYPLWHRGNYQESKILLEAALSLYNEKQIEDGELLSNLYNDLGVIIGSLGNIQKAFEYQKNALEINQNLSNENLADLMKFLSNLALTYSDLGNHQEALRFGQQALEMRRELFGEKHPDVAFSLNNLGSTYSDLGNHQEALRLGQQALEMSRELFGEKHPDVATFLDCLGRTYKDLGKRKEALECHNSALIMRRELLGNKHPNTILTCRNLISVLSETGGLEKAIRLAREFLSYVPQNHPKREFFEKHAKTHNFASGNRKKRR